MHTKSQPEFHFTDLRLIHKTALQQRINHTNLTPDASFVLERWQPGDEALFIWYQIQDTNIGEVLIAATEKGLTYLGFVNNNLLYVLNDLKRRFSQNKITEGGAKWLTIAFNRINHPDQLPLLSLHLKGTDFQYHIWEKLMLIPAGGLSTYGRLSNENSDARAVGGAVGANPVCYFVPCHRVVRSDGSFNGYFWGNAIKEKLLLYEMTNAVAKQNQEE